MDADSVIEQIRKLPPEARRRVEEALFAADGNDPHRTEETIPASERVRRFDEMMARMPGRSGSRVDASRESIYE